MKKKSIRLLPLLLLILIADVTMAETVDRGRARQAATTFLNNNGVQTTGLTDVTSAVGFSNVYVFTTENSFVLMAADDRVQPILGYSLTGPFDIENMPDNKRAWIEGYSNEIRYAIEHQTRASTEVIQQWRDLVEGNPNTGKATTAVAPLVQTQWNQDWPYNNLCPDGTVTGCAATAMAQVLKYWNYPPTGIGMHSYEWNGQTVSADFGSTTYDWENMLNTYNNNTTEAQQLAVATLMFHCGVSLNMDYGWASSGGSGAFSSTTAGAFINYFNYSTETQLRSRSGYSDEGWINMVKTELDQSRPLWYCGNGSGGGHAFVCDGYNSSNYFHFNWGWGGYCDEYYTLDNLSPGPGGIGSGSVGEFNNNQQALFGAQPSPESAAEAPQLTAELITGPGVRNAQLSWNVVSNAVRYKVYRNGSLIYTTNSGSETSYLDVHIGYGTTTYYVRCIDENGIPSWPSNYAPVTIIFPAPTNLTAEQVEGGIQLSWMPCEGAVAYNVYCNNGVLEYSINQTSFYDNRPVAGELSYFVKGVDEFGDLSESSVPVNITIPFTTPVVEDLQASVSGNTVELSWSEPNWCYPETPSVMLNYGSDDFNGFFGYNNGGTYWGHRYPAESLLAYSNMSIYKVSLYARVAGSYEVLVYEGTINGHPQTLVRQQSVWIASDGWFDIDLFEKIQIDTSQDYWVFFHDVSGISCAAAFCTYSGDNGNYYSNAPSSWVSIDSGVAFLIHTYLTDGIYTYNLYRNGTSIANNVSTTSYSDNNLAPGIYDYSVKTNYYAGETAASNQVTVQIGTGTPYTISASATPSVGGTVTGMGSYFSGQTCTLRATASEGFYFVNWTKNGVTVSTNATYSFNVTENATYVANFNSSDLHVFVDYYPNVNNSNSQCVRVYWTGPSVGKDNPSKTEPVKYCVYRAHCDGSEEELIAENVTGNQYIDNGWSALAEGSYRYAVSVVNRRGESGEIQWLEAPMALNNRTVDAADLVPPVVNNSAYGEPSQMRNRDGWLYYDDGSCVSSLGVGGTMYWGTMFPASMLTENRLTKVALYENSNNSGEITLNVYSGGDNAPETLLYTQDFAPIGGSAFHEITFINPVVIDPAQNLWIIFYQSGDAHPANTCIDKGEANNRWISFDGSAWHDLANFGLSGKGWMIRAYVEEVPEIVWSDCIEKPGVVQQSIMLDAGTNWFSTYLEITKEDLQNALLDVLSNPTGAIIKSQDGNSTYRGGRWRDQNFVWDVAKMYMIVAPEDCVITLTGEPINPAEHPITIAPNVSTWIGFPFAESKTPAQAIPAGFAVNGDIIKGMGGNIRYNNGSWRAQGMNSLEPGKGYIYNSKSAVSRTLVFPTSVK